MNVFEAIILGLIQGLTEFIPISSSGHLVIAQNFLIGSSSHLFLEWINIGTMLALVVYFRARLIAILGDIFVRKEYRLARNILITALPAGIVGYFLADFIGDAPFFGSTLTVIVTLTLVGILMVVLEKLPKLHATDMTKLTAGRALVIGLAQMCALIPGVSRSGSTIIAGRFMGLKSDAAAEYSFLASLPVMAGVTLKLFIDEADRQYFIDNAGLLILSNIVAFAAGVLAVAFLMRYLSRHGLAVFGWYRIALAAILSVILLIQSV